MLKQIAGTYYSLDTRSFKGAKIKFAEEKQAYTVRAANVAFAVCTKPFNARKTVLYSIISWHQDIRGTENLIFGEGAETDDDCAEMLDRLTTGETEVSSRNNIKLNIEKIIIPRK